MNQIIMDYMVTMTTGTVSKNSFYNKSECCFQFGLKQFSKRRSLMISCIFLIVNNFHEKTKTSNELIL